MKRRIRRRHRLIPTAVALIVILVPQTVSTWSHYVGQTSNAGNDFSAAASFYRAEVLSNSPVAYYRLGDPSGSTAVDEIGTSNGTYAGGYVLGVAGALANDVDTAVDFDGLSGRVSVPDSPALQLTTQVSLEGWVKPDTLTGNRWIVSKGDQYRLYVADGTTYFGIQTDAGIHVNVTTTVVTTGAWQHLLGTFDGTTMTLYRNGQNVAQSSLSETIQTSTAPLFIGSLDDTSSFFDGGIDEVAVYGTALSSADALAHYERGGLTQP